MKNEPKIRVGVLGSTRGTSSQFLFEKARLSTDYEICVVISNKEDAGILQKASSFNVPGIYISSKGLKRETFDAKVTQKLKEFKVDIILCIGYMRILSKSFVDTWQGRALNVHPSLLPEFAGGMDLDVHQQVLNAGKKETGCTVHVVTEEVDGGPIIVQKRCDVKQGDSSEDLKQRVQALEGPALEEALLIVGRRKQLSN
eukprot:maker-scaffold_17-snap-gene-2.0-mRNA-1 protein AED:0.02 eAED:0.02 QI:56/1/1/1/0.5/0.33/3/95/199